MKQEAEVNSTFCLKSFTKINHAVLCNVCDHCVFGYSSRSEQWIAKTVERVVFSPK